MYELPNNEDYKINNTHNPNYANSNSLELVQSTPRSDGYLITSYTCFICYIITRYVVLQTLQEPLLLLLFASSNDSRPMLHQDIQNKTTHVTYSQPMVIQYCHASSGTRMMLSIEYLIDFPEVYGKLHGGIGNRQGYTLIETLPTRNGIRFEVVGTKTLSIFSSF